MDYKSIIPKRKSVRNYDDKTVSLTILNELKNFYKDEKKLASDIDIEVLIKNKDEVYEQLKGIAGYKGYMLLSPHYLIVLSEEKENYIENTGYIAENIMLKAFEYGVGSCWNTFHDGEDIKKRLGIDSDKKLTAVISLGYDDNKTKILYDNVSEYNPSRADVKIDEDNISTRIATVDMVYLKKWGENAQPEDLTNRGLLEAFHYARLAPSTLNRQPWKFIVDDDIVVLLLRNDSYVNEYEEKIDIGIVILYFDSIIDKSFYNNKWISGKPNKKYNIPDEYKIIGYRKI